MATSRNCIQKAPQEDLGPHSEDGIQIYPLSWINVSEYVRISVDGRCIRRNIDAFSNLSVVDLA